MQSILFQRKEVLVTMNQGGIAYPDWLCQLARVRKLEPETRLGQAFMAGYLFNPAHQGSESPGVTGESGLSSERIDAAASSLGYEAGAQRGAFSFGYNETTPFNAPVADALGRKSNGTQHG